MPEIAAAMARIRGLRDSLLQSGGERLHHSTALSDIRHVVIINSASRSGSSLLFALLSMLPQVCSPNGETNPFYKLNISLNDYDPHVSDRIPSDLLDTAIDHEGLSRDLLDDLRLAGHETITARIDAERYIDDLILRLLLQWTDLECETAGLRACVSGVFERYAERNRHFDTTGFYLDLLEQLHATWPRINPFYYDIGTDRVALRFPFLEVPAAPPVSGFTIEEPPFILLPPRRQPKPADLACKTLLLKSTVDCYRMNLIERLFPRADIRIIHLVRNPAATINGLYDGWLHRGFFSHNLAHRFGGETPDRLRIAGYSDRFPHAATWWNFDLPPGWEAYIERDLVDVCAFQWHSANSEILQHFATTERPVCTIHFEDLIRFPGARQSAFELMLDFMGLPSEDLEHIPLDNLPVVQSTLPPQLYRWKHRRDMIERVLAAPHIVAMAETFGYRRDTMEGWL
ncbi:MAG: sulfotransferase [Geobacteraceae bacterium]|nr:sulfotransferase [Geobacteraceae bacterium]